MIYRSRFLKRTSQEVRLTGTSDLCSLVMTRLTPWSRVLLQKLLVA